jgi:hypothetical protein
LHTLQLHELRLIVPVCCCWLALLLPLCCCCHRLRSMSCKALVTRVRRITKIGKLHSFIKVG